MDNEYLDQTVDAVGQPKPIVAIVGRPNVGKSTLFNRLIGEQRAIVEDVPGTTRDRLYGDADWNGRAFTLVDTGGLDDERDDLTRSVFAQAEAAIAEADAIVFLVDARDDPTSLERDIADLLRRSGKPVVLAANKADSARRRFDTVVYYELGLGEPFPISSVHGTGTGDLLDEIVARLPAVVEPQDEPDSLKLAIVGRPNVGKSSLVNAILGQERAIVSPIPGTTRDAIDSAITAHDQRVTLIDTAGIRRRGRIERGIEHYSVIRALRAISRCDIVLLLIDATEINAAQDSHIAGYAQEEGKGLIILVNKWDLVEKDGTTMYQFERRLREQFNFVPYARFLFISAKTGQRVPKVLDLAFEVREERRKRVSTGELNRVMEEALAEHQPRLERGKRLKLLYGTQADVDPPTFVFFVNDAKLLHFSYRRYLENRLRQAFGFEGTAIRLVFRDREREREREGRAKAGRR